LDLAAHAGRVVVLPRRFLDLDWPAEAMDHAREHRVPDRPDHAADLVAQTPAAGGAGYRPVPRLPVAHRHHPAAGAGVRTPQLLCQLRPAAGGCTAAGGAARRSLCTSTSRTAGRAAAVLDGA